MGREGDQVNAKREGLTLERKNWERAGARAYVRMLREGCDLSPAACEVCVAL